MRFIPTPLSGAYLVEPEPHDDERGCFARTWCLDEFAERGLNTAWIQCNVSYNRRAGTLRGLHYQADPRPEIKLVRCTRGAAFDVIADVRPASPTYGRWFAAELSADNRRALYVPAGFAHGFSTLSDDTELFYQMSERYYPELARGVRWDDPSLGVTWPDCASRVISPRDLALPALPPRLRLLITGATGFVGSACVRRAVEQRLTTHTVARSLRGFCPPGVNSHAADLLDAEQTARLIEHVRPTHLLHLAWIATPGVYWTSPDNARWADASANLLRRFAECGGRRAVVAGSCAEYDWSKAGVCHEATTALGPATPYGKAKDRLRRWAETFASNAGLSLAWARLFFLYGPGEQAARLVPSVARAALSGQPAECSPGTQERDFLHVEDAADALLAILTSGVSGAVNVGSGRPSAVREVAAEVAAAAGRPDLLKLGARPSPAGEPPLLVADVTRLRDEVGWRPRIDLRRGLGQTVAWWRGSAAA